MTLEQFVIGSYIIHSLNILISIILFLDVYGKDKIVRPELPVTHGINWTTVNEKSRTYHFESENVDFKDVVRIEVRPSGKHRIECKDGSKTFVNTGWLYLEIDTNAWSV